MLNKCHYYCLQEIHRMLTQALSRGPPDAAGGNMNEGIPDVAESSEVPPLDNQWIDSRTKQAALKTEKLDSDLKNYKANSIKESIRRGNYDRQFFETNSSDSYSTKCIVIHFL